MSGPSLREIERTLGSLWMNRDLRDWFLSGANNQKAPVEADKLSAAVMAELDKKGVKLYGNLLNFGHQDVMLSIYPYCAQVLGDAWEEIVEDYLKQFPPEHFNFNRLCGQFSEYILKSANDFKGGKEFLSELADLEWLELEKIELDVEIPDLKHETLNDLSQLAKLVPVINPSLTIRNYKYPLLDIIDELKDGQIPKKLKKSATDIAIYRHPKKNNCWFYPLDYLETQIIQAAGKSASYQDLASLCITLEKTTPPQEVVEQFLEIIDELQESYVLIGSLVRLSNK